MAYKQAYKNGQGTRFKPQGALGEPLAKKAVNTQHYQSVDAVLSNRGDRQALIRRYVLEGLQRDGLLPTDDSGNVSP